MIGVKSEVVQRGEANRICILISRESFCAPGDGVRFLGNIPRRATVASISYSAVMRPGGLLRRGVETNVGDVSSKSYRHGKGLDGAIEVLVIDRVLIVPDTGRRVGDLIAHKPNAVVPLVWLDLIYRRSSPRHDGWLLSYSRTRRVKTKGLVNSDYAVLAVGSVVIHVALSWMTLAPDAFVRHDVIRFSEIGCPSI